MSELYNDMDDKSRNAAAKLHIAFDENAWNKMKVLLDEDDRKPLAAITFNASNTIIPSIQKERTIMFVVIFFLLAIALLVVNKNYSKKNTIALNITAEKNYVKNITGQQPPAKKSSSQPMLVTPNYFNKKFLPEAALHYKPSLSLATIIHFDKHHGIDFKQDKSLINIEFENERNDLEITRGNAFKEMFPIQNNILPQRITDSTQKQINLLAGIKKKDTVATLSINKTKKNKFFKNIGFSVFASPEMNYVKSRSTDKVTIGYGAGISYLIGRHFTLEAQFAKRRKVYATDRKGYNPVPASTLSGVNTLNVKADCKIWDMPVKLKYNFNSNVKNDFFISAGISSYVMKKEMYDFAYSVQGQYQTKQRIFKNENKHLFCNLNLSVGYQYWLNKKWSIGFEPYFSLPLYGIGAGKVKLTSAGSLFNLTFKP